MVTPSAWTSSSSFYRIQMRLPRKGSLFLYCPSRVTAVLLRRMSVLKADILIVGIPFLLTTAWFLYWVIRIRGAAKKKKAQRLADPASQSPSEPPR